ncbi:MAG: hypothetical protein AAF610_07345, partial [Pseudomonadota bacterium]
MSFDVAANRDGLPDVMAAVYRDHAHQVIAFSPVYSPQVVILAQGEERQESSEMVHLIGAPFFRVDVRDIKMRVSEVLRAACRNVRRSRLALPVVCLIPDDYEPIASLTETNFCCVNEGELCIDPDMIKTAGFPDACELKTWRLDDEIPSTEPPFDSLVESASVSSQFSIASLPLIKADIAFWRQRPAFCVHSAFPIIESVFSKHAEGVDLDEV